MGKHRHELAAAFFLLGGDVSSAASVCAKNLGDPQLGLVVCRLVEGSDGPIGRNLISKFVYPAAVKDGDYWLASLCQVFFLFSKFAAVVMLWYMEGKILYCSSNCACTRLKT